LINRKSRARQKKSRITYTITTTVTKTISIKYNKEKERISKLYDYVDDDDYHFNDYLRNNSNDDKDSTTYANTKRIIIL
jgi:hypothetical protein